MRTGMGTKSCVNCVHWFRDNTRHPQCEFSAEVPNKKMTYADYCRAHGHCYHRERPEYIVNPPESFWKVVNLRKGEFISEEEMKL